MGQSRNKIKGKRNNQLAQNGLLYDKNGNTFDFTQWHIDHSPDFMRANLEIQSQILQELKTLNLYMQVITDENISCEDT